MNILVATTNYPPDIGGIAELAFRECVGFTEAGYVVTVLHPLSEIELPAGDLLANQKTGIFNSHADKPSVVKPLVSTRPVLRLESLYRCLKNQLSRKESDFLWCPNYRGFGLPVALLSRRSRVPFGIYIHGTELQTEKRSSIRTWIMKWVLTRAQIVCTNSNNTAQMIESEYAVRATVLVPGHSIPLDPGKELLEESRLRRRTWTFALGGNLAGEPIVLISICRLSRGKGIDFALRAVAAQTDDLKNRIIYVIAGDGPQAGELMKLSRQLGIADRTIFTGAIAPEQTASFLYASDIYIQPSQPADDFLESFGISFLEAQAAGLPCLGTRWGGIMESVWENETGLLVRPKNQSAVTKALARLCADSDLRQKMSTMGKKRASGATWAKHTAALNLLLESLLSSGSEQVPE
jgi:glycosyltransferase involved in cell wall biosynthesis